MKLRMALTFLLVAILTLAALGDALTSRAEDTWTTYLPFISRTRTLTICSSQEPDTLYVYASSMLATSNILEAVYDGPIDTLSYSYQPVILTKIPSLADGDAVIQAVNVGSGALVVDNYGNVTTLAAGALVRPAGCRSDDCAITYDGTSPLQMDKLSVTFHMLSDLKWSDGTSLTAQDSVYSFEVAAAPESPTSKYLIDRTEAYTATDSTTLVWRGLPGYLDPSYMVNFWMPLPEHVWGAYTPAELLTAEISTRSPMGYGPYIIDEWVAGSHINLHKNPYYFRADEGLPRFTNLTFRFIEADPTTAVAMLLDGTCDILDQTFGLESILQLLLTYDESGLLQAVITPGTTWEHLDFGIQHISYDDGYDGGISDRMDFFSDVRTRQAIAYCLDRQSAVDTLYLGQTIVLDTYLAPSHPLYDPTAAHYDFDPAAGMALLDQVGWIDHDTDPSTPRIAQNVTGVPNGTPLRFAMQTTTATLRQVYTQIFADSLSQCGIQVDLSYLPSMEWFADGPDGVLFGRKFDTGFFAWLTGFIPLCDLYVSDNVPGDSSNTWVPILDPTAGPQSFPYGWGGQNEIGYYNPEYDQVCNAANNLLPGEDGYITYHQQAQHILAEELPMIPIFMRIKMAAAGPQVTGFSLDPTSNSDFWNIENIDIVP
jgi:peptide/nickel transport system substrate-binding protein